METRTEPPPEDPVATGTPPTRHADVEAAVQALRAGELAVRDLDWSGRSLLRADLSGLDLGGIVLRNADLSRANLAGAILAGADLAGATLFEADLSGAELAGADLHGANLERAKLAGAGLGRADLRGARLGDADASNATLTEARLARADLRACRLEGARLREADLSGADLSYAELAGADLDEAQVAGATLDHADLRASSLSWLRGYRAASWIGADVREVDFTGGYLARRAILDQNFLHEFRSQSRTSRLVYEVWRATSDCGQSLVRWSFCVGVLMLAFAWLYTFVAVDYGPHPTPLSPLYFSVVTMTTLGFGDVVPRSLAAQMIVMAQVVTGYVMLGGLLSLFANKMASRAG